MLKMLKKSLGNDEKVHKMYNELICRKIEAKNIEK